MRGGRVYRVNNKFRTPGELIHQAAFGLFKPHCHWLAAVAFAEIIKPFTDFVGRARQSKLFDNAGGGIPKADGVRSVSPVDANHRAAGGGRSGSNGGHGSGSWVQVAVSAICWNARSLR